MPDAASKLGCTQVLCQRAWQQLCCAVFKASKYARRSHDPSALPQDGSVVAMEYDEKIATFGELPIC